MGAPEGRNPAAVALMAPPRGWGNIFVGVPTHGLGRRGNLMAPPRGWRNIFVGVLTHGWVAVGYTMAPRRGWQRSGRIVIWAS